MSNARFLAVPVHAPREDRRRDLQRLADLLADVAGRDDGPDRVVRDLHVHAHRAADAPDEVLDRDVLLVGDQVGLPVALAGRHHQQAGVDQVVDVKRVVERAAAAEHREPARGDAPVDQVETLGVAGAVDRRGPAHHRREAAAPELGDHRLGLVLGLLVVVGGMHGRLLVRRGPLDVAVHAAGAAVDELAHAGGDRGLQRVARALDVDLPVVPLRDVHLAEGGREVVDELDALHHAVEQRPVGHRPDDDLRAPVAELLRLEPLLVVEGDHLVLLVEQPPHQGLAHEARPARDQHPHPPPSPAAPAPGAPIPRIL